MATEMKAGYHNAVNGNDASHNDRSFEDEKTDELIYKLTNSRYDNVEEMRLGTFLELEFNAYSKICSERLDEINDNYIKQRKKSKCQSMLDYYKKNPPLETCMQLGNVENGGVDINVMKDIYMRYLEKEKAFYKEHNIRFIFLDAAIHGADKNRQVSEATTHVHERKLILYKTKSGTWEPNITKAYEQAGFERPDPSKKSSRYNNVRMTVDEKMRGLWLEACREIVKEKGLDITVPDYEHHEDTHGHSKRRNQKKYIYDKQREEADRKKQLDEREHLLDEREANINKITEKQIKKQAELDNREAKLVEREKKQNLYDSTINLTTKAKRDAFAEQMTEIYTAITSSDSPKTVSEQIADNLSQTSENGLKKQNMPVRTKFTKRDKLIQETDEMISDIKSNKSATQEKSYK